MEELFTEDMKYILKKQNNLKTKIMKLFKVQTKSFNTYYILANDYNKAILKAEKQIKNSIEENIGSSKNHEGDDEIYRIELLEGKIIK